MGILTSFLAAGREARRIEGIMVESGKVLIQVVWMVRGFLRERLAFLTTSDASNGALPLAHVCYEHIEEGTLSLYVLKLWCWAREGG